ncbi:MAG: hypothetical protein WC735_02260 [Candidatus Paceibacterota bacterium]|jgi:hypothetical protein
MITDNCNHTWKKHTDASLSEGTGVIPAYYRCEKCRTLMTAPEVFQLEALENQNKTLSHIKGFQKYIALMAVVISFIALLISIFK